MARQYKDYSDEDVIKIASQVTSMSQLLKELNLKAAGGNYANMKRKLQQLDVDCSHWKGHAWNKDQRTKEWSDYTKVSSIKKHLINERGHKCEGCGLTEWMGSAMPLEVHHLDGNRCNNDYSNLELLCPNCHSLTGNWRGRKNKGL
jgi:hypothetical protein